MQIRRTARTCSPTAFVRAIQFSVSECTPLDRTRSVQLWTDTLASPDRVQPRPIGYAVSGKARVCSVRRPARQTGCSMTTSGRWDQDSSNRTGDSWRAAKRSAHQGVFSDYPPHPRWPWPSRGAGAAGTIFAGPWRFCCRGGLESNRLLMRVRRLVGSAPQDLFTSTMRACRKFNRKVLR
jgi:hypothetical protein